MTEEDRGNPTKLERDEPESNEELNFSRKRPGKSAKASLILAACFVVYILVGFFVAPLIIHSKLESVLTDKLGHPVTVKEVHLNPLSFSLTIRDFEITTPDQRPLVGFDELYVNLELASVWHQALTFDSIRFQLPYAVIRIRKDGQLNLLDLIPATPSTESLPTDTQPALPDESGKAVEDLPPIIIKELLFERGILEFHDDSKPTPFRADIVPLSFTFKNFSTHLPPHDDHTLIFEAELDHGEKIEWQGTLHAQPPQSEGTLTLTGIKIRTLWEYIQDLVRFEITDGVIDFKTSYQAKLDNGTLQATVKEGEFRLTQFSLTEKGAKDSLVSIPAFSIEGVQADLADQQVEIAAVRSQGAQITGWLDSKGRVNYQTLFGGQAEQAASPGGSTSPTPSRPSGNPWSLNISSIEIDDYGLTFEDRTPATHVRLSLEPLKVKLTNVSSQLDSKVDLDFFVRINDTGTVGATGDFTVQPLSADLNLAVSQIPFSPFQPYVDPIANVTIQDGAANLKGHLVYAGTNGTGPQVRYDGMVSITRLSTQDTILNKDLLKWDELAVKGLKLEVEPTRVAIAEIVTKTPYVRFIIGPDRTTNLQEILIKPNADSSADEGQPTPTPAAKAKPGEKGMIPIKIGAIRIVDGSTHFADLSLRPIIDTGIFGMNGIIKGLSSQNLSKADVLVKGKVDKYAPVLVKGQINPLTGEAFTDVQVVFNNVELTTVSPYSTKFAGHPIKKGKVSLQLHYKLAKHLLEAENKVVIDQLQLGEKVESPDATSLPVKLAIALLKDRNGVIDIDLPVRGDLNDPEFHYGKVIINVLVNLVTKAVTSPFNLVAGLVGGSGEELSTVVFPVGSDALSSASEANLKTLAKALVDRPGLRLDVAGAADPEADRAALAEAKLTRELLSVKPGSSRTQGKPDPEAPPTTLQLTATEKEELIKALYIKKFGRLPDPPPARPGEKPQTTQPISTVSLKAQLLKDIKVGDDEIRLLAQRRAKRIQDYLVSEGGITPDRIFLLAPKVDEHASGNSVTTHLGLNAV